MMKSSLRIAAFIAGASLLSGCAGMFHSASRHVKSVEPTPNREVLAQVAMTGSSQLAQGRDLLTKGLVAQAIDQFRLAQRDPGTMAEASNGLGVAYARLGRSDLAERYFRMAVAIVPGDQRFAANLARLYERNAMLADNRAETEQKLAVAEVAPQRAAEPKRIERLSRGEVMLRTVAPEAAAPRARVVTLHAERKAAQTMLPVIEKRHPDSAKD